MNVSGISSDPPLLGANGLADNSTTFSAGSLTTQGADVPADAVPFGETLQQLLQDTAQAQAQSRAAATGLMTGETTNVQDVVLAAAKADLAFQFALEMRNRLIATYQEIMRMQV